MIDDDLKVRRLEGELERLSERLADALRRLDELERAKGASVLASGSVSEDDDGIEPQIEAPDSVNATLEKSFLAPDEIVTDLGSPKRKSISFLPETDGGIQLHEFDDAPVVGALRVVRAGNRWFLVDPDGSFGTRKWLVPIRRETADGIELKWASIGADDSASGSASGSASASGGGLSERTVLVGIEVYGSKLVLHREKHRVLSWEAMQDDEIVGTTCDEEEI